MWVSGLLLLNSHHRFLNLCIYASLSLEDFQLLLLQISIPLCFSSFWGEDNEHSSLLTDVALVPEALFTFLHSFFLFFSYSVILNDSSSSFPILGSAGLNLMLNSYGEFFNFDIVFFSFRICLVLFYCFCVIMNTLILFIYFSPDFFVHNVL